MGGRQKLPTGKMAMIELKNYENKRGLRLDQFERVLDSQKVRMEPKKDRMQRIQTNVEMKG